MLGKILTLIIILAIIYLLFFKFKSKTDKNKGDVENFIQCCKCKTFIPLKDSVLRDSQHICKDCARS